MTAPERGTWPDRGRRPRRALHDLRRQASAGHPVFRALVCTARGRGAAKRRISSLVSRFVEQRPRCRNSMAPRASSGAIVGGPGLSARWRQEYAARAGRGPDAQGRRLVAVVGILAVAMIRHRRTGGCPIAERGTAGRRGVDTGLGPAGLLSGTEYAPLQRGITKGYFSDQGIDLTIEPSTGSLDTLNSINSNNVQFAFVDSTTYALQVESRRQPKPPASTPTTRTRHSRSGPASRSTAQQTWPERPSARCPPAPAGRLSCRSCSMPTVSTPSQCHGPADGLQRPVRHAQIRQH